MPHFVTALRWVVYLCILAFPLEGHAASRSSPLQPTTKRDWRAAGLDGTGCYWSARRDGPVLFAASGRVAVARMAGRVILFRPAIDARDLFPFTYDRWIADGLAIRVMDSAVVRGAGREAVTTDAAVVVTSGRIVMRLHGSMVCGS